MVTIKDIPLNSHNFCRPLQEADEIRLLRLYPQSSNGDIICTVVRAKLSDYRFLNNEKRSHPPSVTQLQKFRQIAKKSQATIPEQFHSKSQLAVEETGLFCFFPSEARVGDVVGQYQNSNILCLLRGDPKDKEFQEYFHLIGRATSYLPTPPSAFFNICGQTQEIIFHSYEYQEGSFYGVQICPDLTTFYMLTCASAISDGDAQLPAGTTSIETEFVSAVPPKQPRTIWRRITSLMLTRQVASEKQDCFADSDSSAEPIVRSRSDYSKSPYRPISHRSNFISRKYH